jgi:hypothetical protein
MSTITISVLPVNALNAQEAIVHRLAQLVVHKATPLFGVDLPFGRESPTFIQNVSVVDKLTEK